MRFLPALALVLFAAVGLAAGDNLETIAEAELNNLIKSEQYVLVLFSE